MAWRIAFAFVALATVSCDDLVLGEDGGKLIYTELVSASPLTPWSKTEHVYVETYDDDEFISKIVVVDMYPDKPGQVEILEGGVGQDEVLLEFSRSGIFRGFQFNVEVYSKHNKDVPPHKHHTHGGDKITPIPATVIPITGIQNNDTPAVPKTLDVGASVTTTEASSSDVSTDLPQASLAPASESVVPQVANLPIDLSQTSSGDSSSSKTSPSSSTFSPDASTSSPVESTSLPDASKTSPGLSPSSTSSSTLSPAESTPVIPENSPVKPFVNTPLDEQTALVDLVFPVNANVTRMKRRNIDDYDFGNTTEIYDESSTDDPSFTVDYQ